MDYVQKLQQYAKRNRQIKALWARGWAPVRIARHFGVSRQRVHQVIRK